MTSLTSLSCRSAAATFFDLPPRRDTVDTRTPEPTAIPGQARAVAPQDTVRPEIENTLDPDSVRALLPRDHAGNIDWMAALRLGVIKPRATIAGNARPSGEPSFQFAFDFYFPGPDTTFDAFFPHSAHTQWVDCRQCHGRIFPYRSTPITMSDLFQGKYCGECHGKVAYPVTSGCERCHQRLSMPADRAQPVLLGNVKMRRVTGDSAIAASDTIGNAAGIRTDALPVATFPHWVHRIRYQCRACHLEIFEPRAGANAVLMKDISDGKACGRCHDGVTAFRSGFGSCRRCHVSDDEGNP